MKNGGGIKVKAISEINEYIEYARSVGKTPEQLEQERTHATNQIIKHEREILLNGYKLTKTDYFSFILPVICKFRFAPDPNLVTWNRELIEDVIFDISSLDHTLSRSAQDKLTGKCDTFAVAKLAQTLRRNYETLRKSEIIGHKFVRAIHNRHACDACNKHDQELFLISEMLMSYHNLSPVFPHELPWTDEVQLCEGVHLISTPSKSL